MKILQRSFLLIIALFILASCGSAPQRDLPCKRIAFVNAIYSEDKNPDIYSICPDGSGLEQLTDDPAYDSAPAWSPDGKTIAFTSTRSGDSQIFIMNSDGSQQTQMTSDDQNDLPVWLPDGKHIAFRTTDGQGLWWWRVMELEGGQMETISEPSYDFFYQTPAWSPDGLQIAYMSLVEQQARNDGSSQIHVKNVDGSGDKALTANIWANVNPVWSPDGKRLAFLSEQHGEYNIFALYIMRADGRRVRQLSDPIYTNTGAVYSWSPDGSQIAIGDPRVGHIMIINTATGKSRELMDVEPGEALSAPSWQPDTD